MSRAPSNGVGRWLRRRAERAFHSMPELPSGSIRFLLLADGAANFFEFKPEIRRHTLFFSDGLIKPPEEDVDASTVKPFQVSLVVPVAHLICSYVSPEHRVSADHPLRPSGETVDAGLKEVPSHLPRGNADLEQASIVTGRLLLAPYLHLLKFA